MKISPITISANYKMNSFKGVEKKPQESIQYSTWGDNYAFPVSSKDEFLQINKNIEKEVKDVETDIIEKTPARVVESEESPEEYYKRKLYSTEWTM